MATIRHSILIDASAERIFSLVSCGRGFSQWWAADVTEDVPRDLVTLGFFNRSTVYTLHPARIVGAHPRRMGVSIRRRMERHQAAIRSPATNRNAHTAEVLSPRLAGRDGLFCRLHHDLGRVDVPIESSRRRQGSGPAFFCHGNGLLTDARCRRANCR